MNSKPSKLLLALLILAFSAGNLFANQRIVRTINDGWLFSRGGDASVLVNIPHSWNAHDTWDEEPGFWRGVCTYSRSIRINDELAGKRVYVRFEGAYQECSLTVNGKDIGRHKGGFTAFVFDATDAVRTGDNDFVITLDNSHNPDIPPLSADFTFYGGVYRDVELEIVSENHISNTYYASSGVFLTTPVVGETSKVDVSTHLSVAAGRYILRQQVFGPDGAEVVSGNLKIRVKNGGEDLVYSQSLTVPGCRLWDVDDPVLYRVVTTLCDAKGGELDSVENPLGFRTFSFDTEKGFTLNGRSLKIIGTNRHQDYEDRGNALADEMHVRDIMLLKEMGGNFLRIAHYPQDPIVTQLCNRLGIVSSIEIPIVNTVTQSDAFCDNCVEMAREMVCQNYNNPSVIIWAYMNEVLLRLPYNQAKQPAELRAYYDCASAQAKAIDDAIKTLDPYRPTMIPCHSDYKRYKVSGVGEVPDILGWNYYRGWYGRTFETLDEELMRVRAAFPDKPLIITEYGAGVDPRLHSRSPERFDFSMEYGLMFHKYYLRTINRYGFIAGSNCWNLNDFYAENRVDAVPHVNNKGLVGLDRTPKDTYLFYQANLLRTPFLSIGGREWKLRGGNEGEHHAIEVYSNAQEVTLFNNGERIGASAVKDGCALFTVSFADGWNTLAAEAEGGLRDAIKVRYAAVPKDMSQFAEVNVSLGSNCYFEDDIQGAAWIPEQEYTPGSWGYVGGEVFRLKTGNGLLPGSNADILGTINDPIFQTQRKNIEAFRADVPDGKYYVYLYFAELAVNASGEPLPYNLGGDAVGIVESPRVFSVDINGATVLKDYNIRAEEGPCRAAIRKFTVDVAGGSGLSVNFIPVEGEPVLNAIRIYRCM